MVLIMFAESVKKDFLLKVEKIRVLIVGLIENAGIMLSLVIGFAKRMEDLTHQEGIMGPERLL